MSKGVKIFLSIMLIIFVICLGVIFILQYQINKTYTQIEELNPGFNVLFNVTPKKNDDNRVKFDIETNLPNGFELIVTVKDDFTEYMGQDKVVVNNGKISTDWFSNNNKGLNGDYEVSFISPLNDLQPDNIKHIIGENGEKMHGGNIRENRLQVTYIMTVTQDEISLKKGIKAKG